MLDIEVALTGYWRSSDTPAWLTDSQLAADHEVPAVK